MGKQVLGQGELFDQAQLRFEVVQVRFFFKEDVVEEFLGAVIAQGGNQRDGFVVAIDGILLERAVIFEHFWHGMTHMQLFKLADNRLTLQEKRTRSITF